MNNKQRLGTKVFFYYLSKRISIGIIFLVIAVVTSSFKENLILKLTTSNISSLQNATNIFNALINGLFIVSILFLIFGLFVSFIKYISCEFTLDENALNISRGFFTKREVSIPYRQIQNINIEQSIGSKMLGICKLVILTEGDHGENSNGNKEGIFEEIDYALAHHIRDFILQRTNIQTVKDIIQ